MSDKTVNWTGLNTGISPTVSNPAAASKGSFNPPQEVETPLRQKVEQWYLAKLRALDGHDAFIAMVLSLILYEKFLRVSEGYDGESFSEGFKGFRLMADHFGISPIDCYHFWQDWRNGLLHRAMPNMTHFTDYSMSADYPQAITITGTTLRINPWKFRDRIISIIEKDRAMWKDTQAPLAKIVTEGDLKRK